jgi:hypothetical protein
MQSLYGLCSKVRAGHPSWRVWWGGSGVLLPDSFIPMLGRCGQLLVMRSAAGGGRALLFIAGWEVWKPSGLKGKVLSGL